MLHNTAHTSEGLSRPAQTMLDISNRFVQVIDQQLTGDSKGPLAEGATFLSRLTQVNAELELSALNTSDRSLKGVTPLVVDVSHATMTVLGALRTGDADAIYEALIALRGKLNEVRFTVAGGAAREPSPRAQIGQPDEGITFEDRSLPGLSEGEFGDLNLFSLEEDSEIHESFRLEGESLPLPLETDDTGISFLLEDDDTLPLEKRSSDLFQAEGSDISLFFDDEPINVEFVLGEDSSPEITLADDSGVALLDDDSGTFELSAEDSSISLTSDDSDPLEFSSEDSGISFEEVSSEDSSIDLESGDSDILAISSDDSGITFEGDDSGVVELFSDDSRISLEADDSETLELLGDDSGIMQFVDDDSSPSISQDVSRNPDQRSNSEEPQNQSWFSRLFNLLG